MNKGKVLAFGRTAEILELDEQAVLKLYYAGFPEFLAQQEFDASMLVYELGMNCPRPLQRMNMEERFGIVYERLNGGTFLSHMMTDPGRVAELSEQMGTVHAELQKQTAARLPSLKRRMRDVIPAASLLSEQEKQSVIAMLERLPEGDSLCHGDFHPDNVIEGERVWVIDWMNAAKGAPAADVARTVLSIRYGTLPEGMPQEAAAGFEQTRELLLQAYSKAYVRHSGIHIEQIEEWMIPAAAVRLSEGIPEQEKKRLADFIRVRLQG